MANLIQAWPVVAPGCGSPVKKKMNTPYSKKSNENSGSRYSITEAKQCFTFRAGNCFSQFSLPFFFFYNPYFAALTHFPALSKKVAAITPCSLKLPNNLSWSHLIEMSESQTCHTNSLIAQRTEMGDGRHTLPFLSKCVNAMWFSCRNNLKIIHIWRAHITTVNSLMSTQVTLSLFVSITVLK